MKKIKVSSVAALLVALALLPWIADTAYSHHLMIMAGVAVILAVSNRLILVSGSWFMGHAAFYAIGAYGVVLLRTKLGLGYWTAFPLIGLIAGVVALGLGYATSRVKGIPFCLISVAFVEVVRLTIMKIPFFGGYKALKCLPPEPILSFDFHSKIDYYYFVLLLVLVVFLVLYLIEKSHVGMTLKRMAESESFTQSLGVDTVRYRVVVLAICAACAGLAGAFLAPYVAVTGPTSFTLSASVIILMAVIVGGMGSMLGPVVGAVFLTLLPEFLPSRAAFQNILFAAIILASLFFLPEGLIRIPRLAARVFRRSPPRVSKSLSGGEHA